jgi:2-phospho-L-lactate guanylyltransferase
MAAPTAGARGSSSGRHGRVDWSIVLPVKALPAAKTRLTGFAPPERARLALAMAMDTLTAVLACDRVRQLVVVTDDETAARDAAAAGAVVVADAPNAGLNPALEHGADVARQSRGDDAIATIAADLPAAKAAELAIVLDAAADFSRAVLADTSGAGTVLLTALPGVALAPTYGVDSLARHQQSGAVILDVAAPGLRRDVDTMADLQAALLLGCGPRTTAVAADLLRNERN